MKQYLGIDIGGTAIKYSLLSEDGNVLNTQSVPTPKQSLEELFDVLDVLIKPVLNMISGLAISMPGRIDHLNGFVFTGGPISSYMTNVPFGELLGKRYSIPCALENDGKCAALAELWKGSLQNTDSGAVLLIGYGIGGGIILNRQLYRGLHGAAGEFSNLVTSFPFDQTPSFWMEHNSIWGLLAPFAKKKGIDVHQVNGRDFFEALSKDDPDARQIYDTYLKSLRSGILSLQAILDVNSFCIGGGISAQDCLIEDLRRIVDDYFDTKPDYVALERPKIERCHFQNDANLVGALKNFLDIHG